MTLSGFVNIRNEPEEPKEWSLYGTLPRSMRETKLVCAVREMNDEEELKRRQELVQSRSPTQLAQIGGLSDMPVPTRLEGLFKKRDRSGSVTSRCSTSNMTKT